MAKITQRKFKRKVHINSEEWTYRINTSKNDVAFLNILTPTGDKQYTYKFEKVGTDKIYCCDLKCYIASMSFRNAIQPEDVKRIILKRILKKPIDRKINKPQNGYKVIKNEETDRFQKIVRKLRD